MSLAAPVSSERRAAGPLGELLSFLCLFLYLFFPHQINCQGQAPPLPLIVPIERYRAEAAVRDEPAAAHLSLPARWLNSSGPPLTAGTE